MQKMLQRLRFSLSNVIRGLFPRQYAMATAHIRNPDLAPFVRRFGWQVLEGHFAGMRYVRASAGSWLLPKLVGSYEWELSSIIGEVLRNRYDTVVDVGCAEGYYAVGLALRLPGEPVVHAFDTDSVAQVLCRDMANLNGLGSRIIVSGFCDPERLKAILTGRTLIICDCEGYELDLLRPDAVPSLSTTDIIVELHDCFRPGLTPTLLERFRKSHDIRIIDSNDLREPADYPAIADLDERLRRSITDDHRPFAMQWAFMTPKVVDSSG